MRQFVFYLDDDTKQRAIEKLPATNKGALAPLIRLLLRLYIEGKITVDPASIEREYMYTTKKNKRSKM